MFSLKVKNSFNKLHNIRKLYVQGMRTDGWGPMHQALEKASAIYMRSMFRRFNRFSMGGGDWAPLSEITIKKKGHDAILVASDVLRSALDPSTLKKSGLLSAGHNGFQIGIPSGLSHPNSKLNIDQLAKVHHFGLASRVNKHLPARKILVRPDAATARQMNKAILEGLRELARRAK